MQQRRRKTNTTLKERHVFQFMRMWHKEEMAWNIHKDEHRMFHKTEYMVTRNTLYRVLTVENYG